MKRHERGGRSIHRGWGHGFLFFAVLGDLFKPKSFAGLFGAAPSVALATLGLTVALKDSHYAATESTFMMAGSVALFIYSCAVGRIMAKSDARALFVTIACLPIWFVVAFGLWCIQAG